MSACCQAGSLLIPATACQFRGQSVTRFMNIGYNIQRWLFPRRERALLIHQEIGVREPGSEIMAVFRWGSALDAFHDLEREMDHLLHSVNMAFEGLRIGRPFPAVNIYELEGEYLLTAELPGTRVEDLDLSVANGTLTLRGKRTASPEISEQQFRRSERVQGQWERSFSLRERIQEDQLHAELQNGVLLLHLPKAPSAIPRQIPVSNGASTPLTIEATGGQS